MRNPKGSVGIYEEEKRVDTEPQETMRQVSNSAKFSAHQSKPSVVNLNYESKTTPAFKQKYGSSSYATLSQAGTTRMSNREQSDEPLILGTPSQVMQPKIIMKHTKHIGAKSLEQMK